MCAPRSGHCTFELYADQDELASMAAAFATLPSKVLWRLTRKEVPNDASLAALGLGSNTQVSPYPSHITVIVALSLVSDLMAHCQLGSQVSMWLSHSFWETALATATGFLTTLGCLFDRLGVSIKLVHLMSERALKPWRCQ